MANLIYLNTDNFDPEEVYDIDLSKNIVASTLESNTIFKNDRSHLNICNKTDIMLQNLKIIDNKIYVLDFNPSIKWSIPKNADINFSTPYIKINDYINTFYIDTIWCDEEPEKNYLISFKYTIHIDKDRTKSATKIQSGESLFDVNFYQPLLSNADFEIDNIYVIYNNYIYEEFKLHFDRRSE